MCVTGEFNKSLKNGQAIETQWRRIIGERAAHEKQVKSKGNMFESFIKKKKKSRRWVARSKNVCFLFLFHSMILQTIASKEGSGVLRNIALTWLMDGSNHISYCPNRALLRVNGNAINSYTGQEALMEMVPCVWAFRLWGDIYSKMVTVRMINTEHRQNH